MGERLYQIYERDLVELERMLPELIEPLYASNQPRIRVQARRIKDILSNVRWNYGPHTNVEVIPADEPPT